jgi:ATPase subunit of ABC transporter with duplicated ATPase domains
MITFNGLSKQYGSKVLFRDVTLRLEGNARYGLTGANGAGKSTLLRILCGDEESSDGSFQFPPGARLGILRQDRFMNDADRILDVAMEGDSEVCNALRAHTRAMAGGDVDGMAKQDDILRLRDGYSLAARAGAVLEGLGIASHVHQQALGTLSGGNKLRVLLAQVLLSRPDVLLLDEPTNHLDILSIRWLERHIVQFTGTAIIISHDARFLDNVATHTLDLDFGGATVYPGGWSKAKLHKEAAREQKEKSIERIQEQIDHKQSFIDRFGAKNTKATQAASRKKQIDKLSAVLEDLPPSSRRAPAFSFRLDRPSGKEAFELRGIGHAFGDKRVLHQVNLMIHRGERVAVIGENGVGKSTLLKILNGSLAASEGQRRLGHEVDMGVFTQDHRDVLTNDEDTPLAFLSRLTPEGLSTVRGMLGKVLFSGEEAMKRIGALSGGEGARLVFAGLMLQNHNTLLLDEPTNHLDIEAIEALTQALLVFPGTIVFVSHDRAFVESLATRVVELKKDGMRDFRGTFIEYLAGEGADHLDAATALRMQRDAAPADGGKLDGAARWGEAKRKKALMRDLVKRRDQAMAALDKAEQRRAGIQARFAADGFYVDTDAATIKSLQQEDDALQQQISQHMQAWEQAESALAALGPEDDVMPAT